MEFYENRETRDIFEWFSIFSFLIPLIFSRDNLKYLVSQPIYKLAKVKIVFALELFGGFSKFSGKKSFPYFHQQKILIVKNA